LSINKYKEIIKNKNEIKEINNKIQKLILS